ncbi:unnamed protein product [Prorocentrum cordatum]|uniref:Sugar phosphate transporter domain-containing protein n=1 Tax=Prorocentrum cordatum TaxID=2364126 RepID=A0ABN9UIM6_9DINO|nr:unnamed protein product [Polarella glacialis]
MSADGMQALRTGTLCAVYILLSGGLINFNKYLMHKGRFPHPMFLTAVHMLASMVLTSLTYLVRPSAMPGVEKCKGKVDMRCKRRIRRMHHLFVRKQLQMSVQLERRVKRLQLDYEDAYSLHSRSCQTSPCLKFNVQHIRHCIGSAACHICTAGSRRVDACVGAQGQRPPAA